MVAGIIAGSISAILAALVSLPLRSPDDILLNSATVVIGSLAAGVAAGVLWRILAKHKKRPLVFAGLWTIGFGMTAIISLVGETQLEHFLAFVLPLAAIAFLVTGLLTILLDRTPVARQWWLTAVAVVIALAVGIPLAGQGDEESGRLELPPRDGVSTPSPAGQSGRPSLLMENLVSRQGVNTLPDNGEVL